MRWKRIVAPTVLRDIGRSDGVSYASHQKPDPYRVALGTSGIHAAVRRRCDSNHASVYADVSSSSQR